MIETHELSKRFNEFWAVDGLNLSVEPGRVLALLGQNGAGKTTTVRMLSALLSPTRGTAIIAGYDVARSASKVRQVVGVLTEQHGLYARMTADEYLDFFGQLHQLDTLPRAARIEHLLVNFGLAGVRGQRIGEYSKGMRQKLALARALIHEPPVLLLDEPTSAMDPEASRLVRDEISSLRSSKRTIVICTHNLAEAEALADSVAIIFQGKILVQGTLAELRRKVLGATEYEARFGAAWVVDLPELPEGVTATHRDLTSMRFRVDNPNGANHRLMQELMLKQAPLVAFQEVQQTLETVYLRAMQDARLRRTRAERDD